MQFSLILDDVVAPVHLGSLVIFDRYQRPLRPRRKNPHNWGQRETAASRFSYEIPRFWATAGNREPLPIVSQLSAKAELSEQM
jgi:hypothetical protein